MRPAKVLLWNQLWEGVKFKRSRLRLTLFCCSAFPLPTMLSQNSMNAIIATEEHCHEKGLYKLGFPSHQVPCHDLEKGKHFQAKTSGFMGWILHPWDSFRHNFLQPRNSSYQPDRIEMAWSLQPIRDVFRVCMSLLVWNSTCNTAFKVCNKHSLLLTQLDIGATLRHISGELQQYLKPYGLRNTLSNSRL